MKNKNTIITKEKNSSLFGDQSGSCISLALIEKSKIFIGNVGDSRILLGYKTGVKQLTTDHKPLNPEEIKRIVKSGGQVHYKTILSKKSKLPPIGTK